MDNEHVLFYEFKDKKSGAVVKYSMYVKEWGRPIRSVKFSSEIVMPDVRKFTECINSGIGKDREDKIPFPGCLADLESSTPTQRKYDWVFRIVTDQEGWWSPGSVMTVDEYDTYQHKIYNFKLVQAYATNGPEILWSYREGE